MLWSVLTGFLSILLNDIPSFYNLSVENRGES